MKTQVIWRINMSTNKKALFFDIDGTILSEITGKIPESASAALQKAHDLGHLLFINTGRTICCLPPMICQLPFSGYLCGCGSYIVYNDEVLTSTQIPKERQAEIIRQVRASNAGLLLEGKEDCYRSSHITRFAKLEGTCRYLATLGLTREHYIESGLCDFDKFVIYTDEQTGTDTLLPALAKDMDLIDRLGGVYEVVPKGYSKGTAIDFILKHFGLELDDAYVFGDSSNDLAMFTYGKHTVALGHHDPVLDPYTEYVTDTVENDGLMKAMAHYGLI